MITCKRVYNDKNGTNEGYRVLVDRLWPRGVTAFLEKLLAPLHYFVAHLYLNKVILVEVFFIKKKSLTRH